MARNVIALAVLAACGSAQKPVPQHSASFECKSRLASYTVSGHISGDELGVQIDCDQPNGPRLLRWKVDKKGTRAEEAYGISDGQFEKLWKEIDGTGWTNLKDCAAGAGKSDPVYTFDVKDDQNTANFSCQARAMPYPYDGLVNPLDLAAAQAAGPGTDR